MPKGEFSETPQPTESKSTDWPRIILAAVLGLALLSAATYAGYWYGTESAKLPPEADQSSKLPSETQIQKIPTPEAIPTPTPPAGDEIKNWETYKNEEQGFELEYPKDWEFTEYTRGTSYFSVRFVHEDKTQTEVVPCPKRTADYATYRVDVTVEDKTPDLSLEEFCMRGALRGELEEATIAGKGGIKYLAAANTSGPAPVVAVKHDGKIF